MSGYRSGNNVDERQKGGYIVSMTGFELLLTTLRTSIEFVETWSKTTHWQMHHTTTWTMSEAHVTTGCIKGRVMVTIYSGRLICTASITTAEALDIVTSLERQAAA